MEKPSNAAPSKSELSTTIGNLARVLGSGQKDAQMCIYDASWKNQFGSSCDIDESRFVSSPCELARVPGVLSVRPDEDEIFRKKDLSYSNILITNQLRAYGCASTFSPSVQNIEYWIVQMEKPGVELVTKAQMVGYFAHTITKVLGNDKDAQVCI